MLNFKKLVWTSTYGIEWTQFKSSHKNNIWKSDTNALFRRLTYPLTDLEVPENHTLAFWNLFTSILSGLQTQEV